MALARSAVSANDGAQVVAALQAQRSVGFPQPLHAVLPSSSRWTPMPHFSQVPPWGYSVVVICSVPAEPVADRLVGVTGIRQGLLGAVAGALLDLAVVARCRDDHDLVA